MTGVSRERWQAEVDARLARLELRADEAEITDGGFAPPRRLGPTLAEDHPDLDAWVRDYFCATFRRPLGGEFRWCAQWREHREAVERLDALWCSWRALRRDSALGMSTWLHQFLDPQLLVLLSARGPFAQCSPSRHEGDLPFPARVIGGPSASRQSAPSS